MTRSTSLKNNLTNQQYGNFAKAVEALGANGIASTGRVIAEHNGTPVGPGTWNQYGWTREARVYAPQQGALLVRDSPLLDISRARAAVNANQRGERYALTTEAFNAYQAQANKDSAKAPAKRNVMILPSRNTFTITPEQNVDVLEFSAGPKQAREYLKRLNGAGINALNFYMLNAKDVDAQKAPFVQQAWFRGLADGSDLGGCDLGLRCDYGAFGVRSSTASEARAHESKGTSTGDVKSERPYTPRQVRKALTLAQGVRNGGKGVNSLDSVISLLESL